MEGMPRIEALTIWETDLLDQMEWDFEGLCRNLGGRPFAIVCAPNRRFRYRRLAEMTGLQLFVNPEVKQQNGFVLIHEGEVAKWLPNYRAPEVNGG